MRKYQPIWESVKKGVLTSIAADPKYHHRIKQGVRKEKNKDKEWLEENKKSLSPYELRIKSKNTLLQFELVSIKSHKTRSPITRQGKLL